MATKNFKVDASLKAWTRVGGYDYFSKMAFHREAKRALKALAEALGLLKGSFEVRSNLAGPACSGEVTLHGDTLYVQVQASCLGVGHEILYRAVTGRKDYVGGQNQFAPASALDDPKAFAVKLSRFVAGSSLAEAS